jgi:hypothetical protein
LLHCKITKKIIFVKSEKSIMDCVYDIFDFLSQEPILESVNSLYLSSSRRFALGLKKIEKFAKQKNEPERQRFITLTIKEATIMHLCSLFMHTKESHDIEVAIQNLVLLGKQEASLVKRQEFEAARLKKNEREKLRDYLNKKNQDVTSSTEESIVNILRPRQAHRAPIQSASSLEPRPER